MAAPTIRRIKQDDPILTHLLICEPPTRVRGEGPHFAVKYIVNDPASFTRLFEGIGNNTHIKDVCFDAPHGSCNNFLTSSYFEGLKRNSSIDTLGLSRCDLSQGVAPHVLQAFQENHEHLVKIALWRCRIEFTDLYILASALTSCANLREINLNSCGIGDEVAKFLILAVKGHQGLKHLDLQDNNIRHVGCDALSTLLQDPECNSLHHVDLRNNLINDEGVLCIAEGLSKNKTLEELYLDENDNISPKGWNILSKTLCKPSSINDTYLSNHTLSMITSFCKVKMAGSRLYDEDGIIPDHLLSLTEMNNSSADKSAVARKKILRQHFKNEICMTSFGENEIEVKVLPHILCWIGRYSDGSSHSAMFDLLKQMPDVCHLPRAEVGIAEQQMENNMHCGKTIVDQCKSSRNRHAKKTKTRFSSALFGTIRHLEGSKPFGRKFRSFFGSKR